MEKAVFEKDVDNNPIFCLFCKRCSGIKLKQDNDFKCRPCSSQKTNIDEKFSDMQLNSQFLEIMERFCHIGDTTEVRARDS